MRPPLSIIIPTLDEADELPKTLRLLEKEGILERAEIILADGGSSDHTVAIAEEHGLQIVRSDRSQRARQLNLGAAAATSDLFLFLHADTHLATVHLEGLLATMESRPELLGGGFFRRFYPDHWFYRISAPLSDARSEKEGLFIGDQAMFCRRSAFESLGGFDESHDVGEDFEFSLRLRESGPVIALGPPIQSSGRRFKNRGVIHQMWLDWRWCRRFTNEHPSS